MCSIRDSPLAELASIAPNHSYPSPDFSAEPVDPVDPLDPVPDPTLDPAASFPTASDPTNPFSTSPTSPSSSVASVTLVGISKDRPEKLHDWAQKLKLPPGMVFLSDPGGRIGKEYGVHSALLGLATTRKTVIVDNGIVKNTYVANVGVKSHAGWVEKHLNTV